MTERFVSTTGTISIAGGATAVTGIGTLFAGRDRAAARVIAYPDAAAPVVVGTVAEVDPRGLYDNLSLPLVSVYNGPDLVGVAYELVDGAAIASGASQAAIFARYAAFLEQNAGLCFNNADTVDFALVPNNSLFIDAVTRAIYQWRNGVLTPVFAVGLAFTPKGAWSSLATYALNDLVESGGAVFVSNAGGNLNHTPDATPASNAYWTWLPLAAARDRFIASCSLGGKPVDGEIILVHVFRETVSFAVNLAGSGWYAETAPTEDAVFTVCKNEASIGTATIATGAHVASFAVAGGVTFNAGQRLTLVAPSPQDTTLAGILMSFKGQVA